MPAELMGVLTWVAEGAVALLLGIVVYFLKKLIDKHEQNGRNIHKLRNQWQVWRMQVSTELLLTRGGIRTLAERLRIKHDDIDGLCDDGAKALQHEPGRGSDSSVMSE